MVKQIYDNDVEVHDCTFQGYFIKAKLNLRFPCSFFIEWRGLNGKQLILSANKYKAKNGIIQFNESLAFSTQMLWDKRQRTYLRKDSIVKVNLVSASRPDQVKLVGQLTLDLSEVANTSNKQIEGSRKLAYCSVEAELMFDAKVTEISKSQKQLGDLDKSSFNIEVYSIHSGVRLNERSRSRSRQSRQILQRVSSEGRFFRDRDFSVSSMNPLHSSRTRTIKNEFIVIEQDRSRSPSTFNDDVRKDQLQLNASGVRNLVQSPRQYDQPSSKDFKNQRNVITQKFSVQTQQAVYSPRDKAIERSSQQIMQRSRENYEKVMAENDSLKREFTKYETKIQILEENMKTLSKELQQAKIRRQVDRISNESKQKAILERKVQQIDSKLRLKQSQLRVKSEEIQALSLKLEHISQQHSSKQKQLRHFIQKTTQLQTRIQELNSQHQKIQQQKDFQINDLNIELKRAHVLIDEMKNKSTSSKGNSLEEGITLLELELKDKQAQLNEVSLKYTEALATIEKNNGQKVNMSKRIQQMQEQINVKDQRLFHFESVFADYEQIKSLNQQILTQIGQIKTQNQKLITQNLHLTNQYHALKPIDLVQQPALLKKSQLEIKQEKLNEVIRTLQLRLKQSQESNKQNNSEIMTLNQENFKLQLQIMQLQGQIQQPDQKPLKTSKKEQKNASNDQQNLNSIQQKQYKELEELLNAQRDRSKQLETTLDHFQTSIEAIKIEKIQLSQENIRIKGELQNQLTQSLRKSTQIQHLTDQLHKLQAHIIVNSQTQQQPQSNNQVQNQSQCIIKDAHQTQLAESEAIKSTDQQYPSPQQQPHQPDHIHKLTSQASHLDQLAATHNQTLMKLKQYEIKISYLQKQLSKSKQQTYQMCPQMNEVEYKQLDEDELNLDHLQQQYIQEHNPSMLDVKIKVNQVASVDESHHSQDHVYVLTEQDYLPYKDRGKKLRQEAQLRDNQEETKSELHYHMSKKEHHEDIPEAQTLPKSSSQIDQPMNNQLTSLQRESVCQFGAETQPQLSNKQDVGASIENRYQQVLSQNQHLQAQLFKLKDTLQVQTQELLKLQQKQATATEQQGKLNEYQTTVTQLSTANMELAQQLQIKNLKLTQLEQRIRTQNEYIHSRNDSNIEQLQNSILQLEQELKIKDELLNEMEESVKDIYNLKFQLAQLLEVKKELELSLRLRDQKINQLDQINTQLNKNIQATVNQSYRPQLIPTQIPCTQNTHQQQLAHQQLQIVTSERDKLKNQLESAIFQLEIIKIQLVQTSNIQTNQQPNNQKPQISPQRTISQRPNTPPEYQEHRNQLIQKNLQLEQTISELKQENLLLNEDMKLVRQQIQQIQEQSLSYKELSFKLEQELIAIKDHCASLENQNYKITQKNLILEEDNLVFKQDQQMHEHSNQIKQRKDSLSLSTSNKLVQLELPSIQQIPQKNESDYLTEIKKSNLNGSQKTSQQQGLNGENKNFHFQSPHINEETTPQLIVQDKSIDPSFFKKQSEVGLALQMQAIHENERENDLERQVKDLRGELQILRQELINESKEHSQLKQTLTQMQQQLNQCKQQSQQQSQHNQVLQQELCQERLVNQSMGIKMKQVQSEMMRIKQDFEDYKQVYQTQINNWIISKDQSYVKSKPIENRATGNQQLVQQKIQPQNSAHEETARLREINNKLEEDNSALTGELIRANDQLQANKQNVEALQRQVHHLKTHLNYSQRQNLNIIQAKSSQSSNTHLQPNQLQSKSITSQLQPNSPNFLQPNLELQISNLSSQLIQAQNKNSLLQVKVQQLEGQNAQLNHKILEIHEKWLILQQENSDLCDQNRANEALIKQSSDEINVLNSTINNLQDSIKHLQDQIKSLQDQIKSSKNQTDTKAYTITQLQADKTATSDRLASTQTQLAEYKFNTAILQQQVHNQSLLLSAQTLKISTLQQQLNLQQKTLTQRQNQILELRQQLATNSQSFLNQLSQKQQLIAQQQRTNRQNLLTIHNLQSQLNHHQLQTQLLTQSQHSLNQQLSTLQHQHSSLHNQFTQLTSKHNHTQNLLFEVQEQVLKHIFTTEQLTKDNADLVQVIKKHQKRQQVMKQHLLMLEEELRGIFDIVKQKQIESEKLYDLVAELQQDNALLKNQISQLEQLIANKDSLLNCYQNSITLNKIASQNQNNIVKNIPTSETVSQTSILHKLERANSIKQFNGRESVNEGSKPSELNRFWQVDSPQSREYDGINEEQVNFLILKNQELLNQNKQLLEMLSRKTTLSVENQKFNTLLQSKQTQIKTLKDEINFTKNQLQSIRNSLPADHNLRNQAYQALKGSNDKLLKEKAQLQQALSSYKFTHGKTPPHNQSLKLTQENSEILKKLIQDKNTQLQTANKTLKLAQNKAAELKTNNQKFAQQLQTLNSRIATDQLNQLQLNAKIKKLQIQLAFSNTKHLSVHNNTTSHGVDRIQIIQNNQISSPTDQINRISLIISQLNHLQASRHTEYDSQKLITLLLQKRSQYEELSDGVNCSNNRLKEKARTVSKEIQKIKSLVVKNPASSIEDKTKMIATIKNCESIVSDLVKITEQLRDPQFESQQ